MYLMFYTDAAGERVYTLKVVPTAFFTHLRLC